MDIYKGGIVGMLPWRENIPMSLDDHRERSRYSVQQVLPC